MVAPRKGREAVRFVREQFGVSERRACRIIGVHRATARRRLLRRDDTELRSRIRAVAAERPRFGYRRIGVLVNRGQAERANHKRVYRLYREEGLSVRRKRRKKAVAATQRPLLTTLTAPNQRWNLDFVEDATADGRKLRTLTIVDEFSRECPWIAVDRSLTGHRVVAVLEMLSELRGGRPRELLVDNGPEFIGLALDRWAYEKGVVVHFTRPGKPTDKAHVESFNGKFRDECLNQNFFLSVPDARAIIEAWRVDYNTVRPHSSLGQLTPAEFLERYTQQTSVVPEARIDASAHPDHRPGLTPELVS